MMVFFNENDGYIDTPKAVVIKLSNGDEFCVEFTENTK